MKQFEIYSWQPEGWPQPHPCVIVSHPSRAADKPDVEVIMCSTQQATRQPQNNEVILDTADGLNWETICKCDLIYTVPRKKITNRRGLVSLVRRMQIIRTIIASHGWGVVIG